MCGIAGFYGAPKWELPPRRVLERMLAAIRHRGPDDWGLHLDGPVGLGHVRLSIIDLAGGRQPMADEGETIWVTFNGEIFNYVELKADLISAGHRFRTSSDTEVILEAYRRKGPRCVEDFNGDFAFALWDRQRDRLMLARDRMGVRPVYYAIQDGVLVFGSEVKALLQVPGIRARSSIRSRSASASRSGTRWPPGPPSRASRSCRRDTCWSPSGGTVTVRPYWQPSYPATTDRGPGAAARGGTGRGAPGPVARRHAHPPPRRRPGGSLPERRAGFLGRHRTGPAHWRPDACGPSPSASRRRSSTRAGTSSRWRGRSQCDHESVTVTNQDIAAIFPDVIRHAERPVLRTAPAPLYPAGAAGYGRIPSRSS